MFKRKLNDHFQQASAKVADELNVRALLHPAVPQPVSH